MKIKLFDYHIQALEHGIDKPLRINETVEAAIKLGFSSICFTDHFPLPSAFVDLTEDIRVKYPEYVSAVVKAKNKYKNDISINLGTEIDWLPDFKLWIEKEIQKYPFDYVIGSVHYVDNYPIDYNEKWLKELVKKTGGIKKVVLKYYEEIRSVIQSNLFDGLGHLDKIKKLSEEIYFHEDEDWYRKEVDMTLEVLRKSRMVMEVNSSGLTKPFASTYPSFWILKEAKEKDIQITLGSDAHIPENVGKNIYKAVRLAKLAGYRKIVFFNNRNKVEVEL